MGPPQKRQRTSPGDWASVLPALEPAARDLLGEAALEWAVGHFAQLGGSASWLELQPTSIVRAANAVARHVIRLEGKGVVGAREWSVVNCHSLRVRCAKDLSSDQVGSIIPGDWVLGYREGDWLAMLHGSGYALISNGKTVFLEELYGAVARGAQYDVRRLHDECELGTVLDASVRQRGAGSQHRVAAQQPLSERPAASSTGHAPGRAHCALHHLAHRRGAVQDQRRELRPADSRNNYAHGACAEILLSAQTQREGAQQP